MAGKLVKVCLCFSQALQISFQFDEFFNNSNFSSFDSFPCQMSQGVKGLSEAIHSSLKKGNDPSSLKCP